MEKISVESFSLGQPFRNPEITNLKDIVKSDIKGSYLLQCWKSKLLFKVLVVKLS